MSSAFQDLNWAPYSLHPEAGFVINRFHLNDSSILLGYKSSATYQRCPGAWRRMQFENSKQLACPAGLLSPLHDQHRTLLSTVTLSAAILVHCGLAKPRLHSNLLE